MHAMKPIKNILIVGGGSAGWLTAAYLAKVLGCSSGAGPTLTLMEASDIGIIGVGEGSFPSLRGTLSALGIDEARFVRECSATFKQGIRFDHWLHAPGSAAAQRGSSGYFHPFSSPSQRPGGPELLPYWLQGMAAPGAPFASAATMQSTIVEAMHAPKRIGDADFSGPMNYAYHFDAGRFAGLLGSHARSLGVQHVLAQVEQVELDEVGAIKSLHTRCGRSFSADLYIDCTGFHASLIGGALGSPFRSVADSLFVDRALALQVPYGDPAGPIASCTISTACEAGWTWDIGLQERRGVGYVYSSRHTDDARAEQVLRQHVGPESDALNARKLELRLGYREQQWVKNCVAIGLSSGFLEPLEASGIGLVETAAYLVAHLFPHDGDTEPVARRFNSFMRQRYEHIVDFIKLHYCLSQRQDSAFWRDNRAPASIPASLQDRLAMWRCRPPHRLDFFTDIEMYPPSSWQYVLYGMQFETRLETNTAAWPRAQEAAQEFAMIGQMAQRALADLPTHRSLVQHLRARAGAR
jgi:tryptophan halogenase